MFLNGCQWPPDNAGSEGCPVSVASLAARTMDIFSILGPQASAESCAELSQRFISRNRENLQRVRKDGCPFPGASVLAHLGA